MINRDGYSNRGFTLIEIIIVIVIMAMMAAVVTPLTVKELNKSRAKTEYLQLRNIIKSLTTKAFAQGLRYRIKMLNKTLTSSSALGEHSYQFEHLTLPNLTFNINANGYPSIDYFEVKTAATARRITLEDMLGVKQDLIYAKNQ